MLSMFYFKLSFEGFVMKTQHLAGVDCCRGQLLFANESVSLWRSHFRAGGGP